MTENKAHGYNTRSKIIAGQVITSRLTARFKSIVTDKLLLRNGNYS
ncbi:MAG: hypothetical protein U9R19_01255 [Bacteroidota bacterium]|nr:hypothetical protein [Bacteroidota bacterium]